MQLTYRPASAYGPMGQPHNTRYTVIFLYTSLHIKIFCLKREKKLHFTKKIKINIIYNKLLNNNLNYNNVKT